MDLQLSDHLCFKLYVASRLIIRGYGEALAHLDITYPKYLVLLALDSEGRQTVSQLATRLSLDFGTLSPLLKSLAAQGFVTRNRDRGDDRVVTNALTPSGRAVLKKAMVVAMDLHKATQIKQPDFVAFHAQMDDYIGRCQRILEEQQTNQRVATVGGKQRGRKI